jgi:hypothetical protein
MKDVFFAERRGLFAFSAFFENEKKFSLCLFLLILSNVVVSVLPLSFLRPWLKMPSYGCQKRKIGPGEQGRRKPLEIRVNCQNRMGWI